MFKIKLSGTLLSCMLPLFVMANNDSMKIEQLQNAFNANPSDVKSTVELLNQLEGIESFKEKTDSIINIYFSTQQEADYLKPYNWNIVKDFVDDIRSPYLRYVFKNRDKYAQQFSKDDVYQKLDNAIVDYLEPIYITNRSAFATQLTNLKEQGYQHVDIVADYFTIRELNKKEFAEDYFYKARKLFRYFPEDRCLIKQITADAITIMDDVSHLKVIQLWAGKTVEKLNDMDAIGNYILISQKCGYTDVARSFMAKMKQLAKQSGDELWIKKANEISSQIG
ncbi:MAG: hypothetical protein ACRDDZ_12385 [Marinifilaceae bacterium]